ncbi:hypothetical protein P885DRAFT_71928 [Corynascus similis CBS 632.67]
MDAQTSLHLDGSQNSWQYTAAVDQPLSGSNGMWQSEMNVMPMAYYDTQTTLDAPSNDKSSWNLPIDSSMNFSGYGQVWPIPEFPTDTFTHNAWSPSGQPLPSPLSEAPPYIWAQSPAGDSPLESERRNSTASQIARSSTNSPVATISNQPFTTPALKPKDHQSSRKTTKRSAAAAAAGAASADPVFHSRPKHMLKRHKSDTPSIASIASISTSISVGSAASASTATTHTTLGGVLPANVDPRIASEQIKREAWGRCKAEAAEMEQRRMMLLDHERGALEREARRLQVNLGLMREAAAVRRREEEQDQGNDGEIVFHGLRPEILKPNPKFATCLNAHKVK